ncbi:CHAT domain-containing tetratricopeptide repeat protein [Pseudorhodobacter sp.]|uniref:CHAT domain-containing tetratricopeptide repeat protein n=1 Tax=Pseudorhodobacter sp. TaxID=1934400 RepID=UPI002649D05C|nr:CHAT domain-containing tetratricopeptide repeat protein [Pseudorhodobacter sp.]MDN5787424.1 CHAT domain-containing protein [Pseudorhodobacter sp.]
MRQILFVLLFSLVFGQAGPACAEAYTEAQMNADGQKVESLFVAGDFPAASALAHRRYLASQTAFGPTTMVTLEAGLVWANILRMQEEGRDAANAFEDLYILTRANYLPGHALYAKMAMGYGLALSDIGENERALPLIQQGVSAAEFIIGPDAILTLTWRQNLATLYASMGMTEDALAEYGRIFAVLDANPNDENLSLRSNAHQVRALILLKADRWGEAANEYEVALPLLAEKWGEAHPFFIKPLLDYADSLWPLKEIPAALEILDRAEPLIAEVFGPQSLEQAKAMQIRGLALTVDGPTSASFDDGLIAVSRAIEIKATVLPADSPELGSSLLEYAAMLRDRDRPGEALDYALRAEVAGNRSRGVLLGAALEAYAAGELPAGDAGPLLFRVVQEATNSQLNHTTRQLGARLALGEDKGGALLREITDRDLLQTQMQSEYLSFASLPYAQRDLASEAVLRQKIQDNATAREAALAVQDRDYPDLTDLIGNGSLSLDELRDLLGADSAVIVLDTAESGREKGVVLAVTRDDLRFAEVDRLPEILEESVAELRSSISLQLGTRAAVSLSDPESEPRKGFDYFDAAWLYRETIGKVDDILQGKTHLYVVTKGALASLPPQMLIVKDDPASDLQSTDWLIRHYAVTVLPSVYALKLAGLAAKGQGDQLAMLGFADPIYDVTAQNVEAMIVADAGPAASVLRGALAPLPETAAELSAVAASLGNEAEQLVGADASERAVKAADLSRYRMLYFATHGLVSGDVVGAQSLAEPALALTAGQGEDGLLLASEIENLKLNADLVVLSACNTAQGDKPGAEALSGLVRSFTYAGARGLMVSHWPVESRSAVRLMTDMFARRANDPKLGIAQAQQQAILAMIDHPPNPKWSHPAYWAPFVLVGAPQ